MTNKRIHICKIRYNDTLICLKTYLILLKTKCDIGSITLVACTFHLHKVKKTHSVIWAL